jgi:hypothetical protein
MLTAAGFLAWRLDLKKPKRRRPAPGRKPVGVPGMPAAPAGETEASDRLAGMMRARLALMPPKVAADYRALAQKDDPTIAEKARLSVLEDSYAPSAQQLQAVIAAVHDERRAQSRGRPAAGARPGAGSSRT